MTGLRILLVEDEPDIREIAELSLSLDADLETRSCGSGAEALSLAARWSPDLILLDVMMPEMDGPATLAQLRRNARTDKIPVVFMTARAQAHEIEMFHALGVAGVIAKPFDPLSLAASLRACARAEPNRMAELRADFMGRLREDAAALATFRTTLTEAPGDRGALRGLRAIAHSLAGAGGIYGCPAIGEAAADLEDAIVDAAGEPTATPAPALLERLLASIAAARAAT